jgi:hypothetical protein
MLISGAGVVAAAIGLLLLPWFESDIAGTTVRASFAEVMRTLDANSSELSPLEGLVIGQGPYIAVALAVAGLFSTGAAFVGYKTKSNERVTVTSAAVINLAVAAYLGWVVYATNREVNEVGADLFTLGIDYRVGAGAWVTIVGIVAVAGGLLYSSPPGTNSTTTKESGPTPQPSGRY